MIPDEYYLNLQLNHFSSLGIDIGKDGVDNAMKLIKKKEIKMKIASEEFDFIESGIENIHKCIQAQDYAGASFILGRLHKTCRENFNYFYNEENGKVEEKEFTLEDLTHHFKGRTFTLKEINDFLGFLYRRMKV